MLLQAFKYIDLPNLDSTFSAYQRQQVNGCVSDVQSK